MRHCYGFTCRLYSAESNPRLCIPWRVCGWYSAAICLKNRRTAACYAVFGFGDPDSPMQTQNQSQEIPLLDYHEMGLRRSHFFLFLHGELAEIDAFHKGKPSRRPPHQRNHIVVRSSSARNINAGTGRC